MNGQLSGSSAVIVDGLIIPASPLESTAFVMALDENLVGKWVSIDTTLSNGDGRIEANIKGIFAYQETLTPPFNLVKNLKKFNFEGELIKEVVVPSFNSNAILRPDLEINDNNIAMYCKNSFSNDSYILHIFNITDLEHLQEKVVSGASDPYSNQLAVQDQNFIIGGIQADELSFNDEIMLPYAGSGSAPYIAKIKETTTIGINGKAYHTEDLLVYPNPARNNVIIQLNAQAKIEVYNQTGQLVKTYKTLNNKLNMDISDLDSGIYFIKVSSNDQIITRKLVIE
jgi:hypothetical protein